MLRSAAVHFDIPALRSGKGPWRIETNGSPEALKRLLDKKTDAAVLERDGAKRKAMYEEIQAEFRKNSPFVMLFQQTEVAALRSDVEGLKLGPTSDTTYMFLVTKK